MAFENKFVQQRIEKAELLKKEGINPYSNDSKRNTTIIKYLNVNSDIESKEEKRDEHRHYIVSGRIKLFRIMGKASFIKIEDESGMLQVYVARDNLPEGFYNDVFKKLVEVGDIVEISGYPFVTGQGELSLHASEVKLLTKAISPLPEKFHGVTDKEIRYRKRYLDLIMNSDIRRTFQTRSKVISLTRRFFEEKGFLEVETPMMHPIAGGANARPFITHHNALGIDRFLRIAPELYLKRLIVGGFEAVFEINRNFRNEGMDATHNPEFTSIEFYWAYKTYKDLIVITKEYFKYLFDHLNLPTLLPYGDLEVNFGNFTEIPLIESLTTIGGVPAEITNSKEEIVKFLNSKNITVKPDLNLGQLQGELFDEFVEGKLIDPTFITEYPVEISPLARRSDENPDITERFELFIAGREIANAFSELNDPVDQYNRFKGQVDAKDAGDDEAHEMDEDFIDALSYGMAPTAGQGIGIDRLVMLLTNEHSIRDVLLFPAMKPIHNDEQTTQNEEL
ncbi:MAG: lysine--tRNA ligase [Epsilonproteobacteria bacterium]|nr:lysine--tRNA ligase [Campylobacterota bacterium]OIO14833.1 MAG: lysine--tRNA ligase [Helicobacteraceae bacterium CG1_02_36_14]PIP10921.1 MAG: lysine--tRNA ligase [Sulfurimonas sp. CG23_combo_of_CG06-09_8_20_14_all_36_33]PIS26780.1 MAG: lysine--tRNA ligase [Sulfurimonas sp. CG08_land_8_20_14_0_20_36_33]PIU35098.1 MAG: lysine--tRNA ligase [Sulfurimonas sp. CG07_land_8_20_14_0_80_36_56]PIV03343.1 MAG: lysine--tRNA ligase [Sulfurimonas sp. CG03_land_8_20_14_0_80_36_25]PIV36566.1 MAG: lysine--t